MLKPAKPSANGFAADDAIASTDESFLLNSTERYPTTTVRINSLVIEESPRRSGVDPEHARLLAETDDELPPIIVHQPTMRVIDGMHRIQAALLRGSQVIEARLLDCDERTAFVLAVKANITHGLPLTQIDRKAAAARIIESYPQWSNRAVAAASGLSDKTVSRIRDRSTTEVPQSDTRLGRDGRRRPLSTEAKRRQAAELIKQTPEAGLREVARATGLSPATVRDVRQRVERREDPVPHRYRGTGAGSPAVAPIARRAAVVRQRQPEAQFDSQALLAKLRNDPSLRFNEDGRRTLRWLHQHAVRPDSWESLGLTAPDHCMTVIADLARSCAAAWSALAEQLDRQAQQSEIKRKAE